MSSALLNKTSCFIMHNHVMEEAFSERKKEHRGALFSFKRIY